MGDGGRGEPDGGDVLSEFAAEALALVDKGLALLLEVRPAALSAGELRALARAITARQGVLASAGFRTWVGMDARDDVVPKARPGQASVAFQRHALGIEHPVAARESATAHLLDPDTGDLKTIGAAYATGAVLRGHVDVAARTHKDLGPTVREELVPDGDGGLLRRIEAVDALLELESRRKSVREVDTLAKALVDALNPKTPEGAHERR